VNVNPVSRKARVAKVEEDPLTAFRLSILSKAMPSRDHSK